MTHPGKPIPGTPPKGLRLFCNYAITVIVLSAPEDRAAAFVARRMELQNLFLKGRVLSTIHGTDIFANIINCLDGHKWEEAGEYGANFRSLIADHRSAKQ